MARKTRTAGGAADDRTDLAPRLPVVGIGASAGGVKALRELFDAMPEAVGAAFVVIMHLDPERVSELPNLLAARSRMPVTQVTGPTALKPDCIYVIAPDRELKITDHEISAEPFTEPRGKRAAIDHFLRSLADQHGDGFAVILSGAGSDGTIGVKAVKAAGGIILVQDPAEAEYASMPRSAIATEAADFVLPVRGIAQRLAELIREQRHGALAEAAVGHEDWLRRILAHLRVRTGHDFSHYKRSTVIRRILRRVQVTRRETLDHYFAYLRENADEAQALLADLLISVTTFFRDADAFGKLASGAIGDAFRAKPPGEPIRVWVAGCATGEEAYSIAMLLIEEAGRHDLRPEIQVFATDMDARALNIAREGRYPTTIEADVSEERLRRFFTQDPDGYRVKRELRDAVLFAPHSLLKDPPFSRLDLISCRNVLIYLDRDLQQQVLSTLHYGLNTHGYLFLGSSESAEQRDGFRVVDRDSRIYQAAGRPGDRLPALSRVTSPPIADLVSPPPSPPANPRRAQATHREALETQAPPSILVDDTRRVLHLSEHAGRFLQPSGGPLTTEVTDLVRLELRFEIRAALDRAFADGEPTLSEAIFVRFNGQAHRVYLQVRPVPARNEEAAPNALVMFIEGGPGEPPPAGKAEIDGASGETVERLRRELELTQSRLRTVREESEAANEELRAANEELQSINEEYRSIGEELETSKEELQSINEELQTVNSELKIKLDTVSRANSDLQNLMAAMDFGVLFLDPGLRIKRFTPRLADLFSITPGDIGRPITDFAHQLDYDGLAADVRNVLENLSPIEREIRSRAGGWYVVRFRPYRTVDDKIDGVVATFLDITERRRMEDALRGGEERLRQEVRLVEMSRTPIFVWDYDGGILEWNRGCEELYGYPRAEAVGRDKTELLRTTVPGSSFEAVKAELLKQGSWSGELRQVAKDGRPLIVEAQIEMAAANGRRYVLESTRDVTQIRASAARQQLLLSELTHRVKNTLTVVQSMVRQTWRHSHGGEDFVHRLEGRILAMAGSHKLLIDSDWGGADLRRLVETQLAANLSDGRRRVRLTGKPIVLPPDIATPLGLIMHELATNAVKYGALSSDGGHVDLTWSVAPARGGNEQAQLTVVWSEKGGPPVEKPSSLGFGSRLITEAVPGVRAKQDFAPDGVVCTLEIPLPEPDHERDVANQGA
jgi:two-component system CheB/CheR fusion protein